MEQTVFGVTIGGIPLTFQVANPEAALCFGPFREEPNGGPVVRAPQADLLAARQLYPAGMREAALEYNVLCGPASDALLPHRRCLFHGAAFLWRGKAWIFTAPSGTGKTTQYVLWKMLYGDEIAILNGDKPVLEARADGIWVHPSPWVGKECMGRPESAPLGGVIYLAQGPENAIRPMPAGESAAPIFAQFLFTAAGPEDVSRVCALEEALLRAVPVWLLTNRGDEASARLAHDTISQWEEQHHA